MGAEQGSHSFKADAIFDNCAATGCSTGVQLPALT